MNKYFLLLLILSLSGCTDNVINVYDTYKDAIEDGAIKKGWMPSYYPKTAKNIILVTNLDLNIFVIKSEITKGNINGFKANCTPEKSSKEIRYFDDVKINENPSYLRFNCKKNTFVEILNEQYVFYSNDF